MRSCLPDEFVRIRQLWNVVADPAGVLVWGLVEVDDAAGLARHHLLPALREHDERTQVEFHDAVVDIVRADRCDFVTVDDGFPADRTDDRPSPLSGTSARVAPVRTETGEEPERPERTEAECAQSKFFIAHGVDHLNAFADDEGIPRVDSVSASANGRGRVFRGNDGEREVWRTDAGDRTTGIDVVAHEETPR